MEKNLLHQRGAVVQTAKFGNNHTVSLNNKRLLTNEKILKNKVKQRKSNNLLKARKVKKKYRSYSNNIYYKIEHQKIILKKKSLDSRKAHSFIPANFDETTQSESSEPTTIDSRLVWVMAATCGLSVANLVYAQPLLAAMGHSFAVPVEYVGFVPTLGQFGYGVGLILIAPLTEKYNRRNLIIIILCAIILALIAMAVASTVAFLTIASCAVGLVSILPELLIPFAASLAPSNKRGHIVGIMGSAILVGTLLANFLSGFVGEYLGWRAMYWIAATMIIILVIVLYLALPADQSAKSKISYPKLLGSLWTLLLSEPVLQEISIIVILVYGSFSAFWVTLSFFLETPPYHYGSDMAGLLGLVGIAGASVASFVGKFADRRDPRYANAIALPITLLSFVMMWLVGQWFIGLIIGAILLDLGTQSSQVANQTRIYTLEPTAWNRLNTVYIFMFSIGASFGCVVGTLAWGIAKWNGVCSIASLMLAVALCFYIFHGKRIRRWKKSQAQQAPLPTELAAGAT